MLKAPLMPEIMRLERLIGNFSVFASADSNGHSLLLNPTTGHENATTLRMSDSRRMCPRQNRPELEQMLPPPSRQWTTAVALSPQCPCTLPAASYKAADLLHPQPGPTCLRLSVTSGVPSGGLMETRCELLLARLPTGTKAPAGSV